jgi:uncharacterized protein YuzE
VKLKGRYDREADAACRRIGAADIRDSAEISPDISVDFDANGKTITLEFLHASECLSAEALMSFKQAG